MNDVRHALIFSITRHLRIAQQHANTLVSRAGGPDLPAAQLNLLGHFDRFPGQNFTVQQLADAFGTNQPAMSKLIARMVEKGLLTMTVDPMDRRGRNIAMTREGSVAFVAAADRVISDLQSSFESWTDDELDRFAKDLIRLSEGTERAG